MLHSTSPCIFLLPDMPLLAISLYHLSDMAVAALALVCLLICSNAILALVNVLLVKKSIRIYNIVVTALLAVAAMVLFTVEVKAAAIALFVVLIHGFLIYLSFRRGQNTAHGS